VAKWNTHAASGVTMEVRFVDRLPTTDSQLEYRLPLAKLRATVHPDALPWHVVTVETDDGTGDELVHEIRGALGDIPDDAIKVEHIGDTAGFAQGGGDLHHWVLWVAVGAPSYAFWISGKAAKTVQEWGKATSAVLDIRDRLSPNREAVATHEQAGRFAHIVITREWSVTGEPLDVELEHGDSDGHGTHQFVFVDAEWRYLVDVVDTGPSFDHSVSRFPLHEG
jgi:hypothetical protein